MMREIKRSRPLNINNKTASVVLSDSQLGKLGEPSLFLSSNHGLCFAPQAHTVKPFLRLKKWVHNQTRQPKMAGQRTDRYLIKEAPWLLRKAAKKLSLAAAGEHTQSKPSCDDALAALTISE